MARKDYELIAKAIYGSLIQSKSLDWQDLYAEQHHITARHIANALERTNPRFDRERFLTACGVLTNTKEV